MPVVEPPRWLEWAQEIPASLSGEPTHPRHIQDAFRLLAEPDCPTVFD